MSTEQQKYAFLEDHGPYELGMLRYALAGCQTTFDDQLKWNVHFESFVVHARNLYSFLANEDRGNFQARDFVATSKFEAKKTSAAIATFQKLRAQVLHMGKNRPLVGPLRAQLSECEVVSKWIEENFRRFVAALEEPYSSKWSWDRIPRSSFPTSSGLSSDRITQTGTPPNSMSISSVSFPPHREGNK